MRCKLCDNVMKPTEVIWEPEKMQHVEWCGSCRKDAAFDDLDFDITTVIDYHMEPTDQWDE